MSIVNLLFGDSAAELMQWVENPSKIHGTLDSTPFAKCSMNKSNPRSCILVGSITDGASVMLKAPWGHLGHGEIKYQGTPTAPWANTEILPNGIDFKKDPRPKSVCCSRTTTELPIPRNFMFDWDALRRPYGMLKSGRPILYGTLSPCDCGVLFNNSPRLSAEPGRFRSSKSKYFRPMGSIASRRKLSDSERADRGVDVADIIS